MGKMRWRRRRTCSSYAPTPSHTSYGLGFIEASLRGQLPFSFCMGLGLAGAVANRMFHEGHKLMEFRHWPVILVAAVLPVCVAPYFVFTSTLMWIRRRGMLRYGALARAVGSSLKKSGSTEQRA